MHLYREWLKLRRKEEVSELMLYQCLQQFKNIERLLPRMAFLTQEVCKQ